MKSPFDRIFRDHTKDTHPTYHRFYWRLVFWTSLWMCGIGILCFASALAQVVGIIPQSENHTPWFVPLWIAVVVCLVVALNRFARIQLRSAKRS